MLLHLFEQRCPYAQPPEFLRHVQRNNVPQRGMLLRQDKPRELLAVFRHQANRSWQAQVVMQRPLAVGNSRWKTLLVQLMQPRKVFPLILPYRDGLGATAVYKKKGPSARAGPLILR